MNQSQTSIIDPNSSQYLANKFNTTAPTAGNLAQITKGGAQGHMRAGTQIDIASNKMLSSEPSLMQTQPNVKRVDGSEQKGS